MGDEDSLPPRRGPEWFVEKINEGLKAAEIQLDSPAVRPRMSRTEIEDIVSTTLREELERLEPAKPDE
jgi:hypothetical protein